MAKKLKTLAAERSLDIVELNSRQCIINTYAGKLSEIGELPLPSGVDTVCYKPEFQTVTNEVVSTNLASAPQEFMEYALFSDADTNTSLMCEKLTDIVKETKISTI
nr:occludin-related Y protein [Drosophila ananassae]